MKVPERGAQAPASQTSHVVETKGPKPNKVTFAPIRVPKRSPQIPPREIFQMLDSVRIKRDVPGTQFRKGMKGAIVNLFGSPPRAAHVEIISPPYIDDINVEDLELLKRY